MLVLNQIIKEMYAENMKEKIVGAVCIAHGLRTPNEGINEKYLKNWADVADKICFGRT